MPSLIESKRVRRPLALMQLQVHEFLKARGGALRFSWRCEQENDPNPAGGMTVYMESWDVTIPGERYSPDNGRHIRRASLMVEYLPTIGEVLLWVGQEWDGGPDLKSQLESLFNNGV